MPVGAVGGAVVGGGGRGGAVIGGGGTCRVGVGRIIVQGGNSPASAEGTASAGVVDSEVVLPLAAVRAGPLTLRYMTRAGAIFVGDRNTVVESSGAERDGAAVPVEEATNDSELPVVELVVVLGGLSIRTTAWFPTRAVPLPVLPLLPL